MAFTFHLICFVLFLVPYILPQILTNKKVFIGYLIICTCIAGYLAWDIYSIPPHKRWDGPGGVFGLMFMYQLIFGTSFGILVRVAGFYFSYKRIHKRYYWYLLLIIPMLFSQAIFFPSVYQNWKRRPPTAKCFYDVANIRLGNTTLEIPTFPIIKIGLDDGNQTVKKMDTLYFFSPKHLRKLCSVTDNGKETLPVNSISINFSQKINNYNNNSRFKELCKKSPYFFCKDKIYPQPIPDIDKIRLYVDNSYNADKMYGGTGDSLIQDLKNNRAGVQTENKERYTYVSIKNIQTTDQEPISFRCRDNSDKRYCQTNVAFTSDVRLIVEYVVSAENTQQDIMSLHQQTMEFLNALQHTPAE